MRILFATPHLFPDVIGGSGLHSLHLARRLARAGHELDVLHPFTTEHFSELPQVREHALPFGRTVMDFARRVDSWIGDRSYDLGYSDGLCLSHYVKRKIFPVIVNDHGLLQFQPQHFGDYLRASPGPALKDLLFFLPRIRARTQLARRADFVVTMGGRMDEIVRDRLGIPQQRVLHLPNAVDIPDEPPAGTEERDPCLFLFVGKIEFRKGVVQLLEAFHGLRDTPARLRLVGDGPMARAVRRRRLPNVEWAGPRFGEQLEQEYRAAGAFLLPSLQEGMPTAVMEAQLRGLPVIATDVGATRLLVTKETGLLLLPHDAGAVEAAVRRMLEMDPAERGALGLSGRKLIRARYTWDRVGPRFLHSFRHAAGAAGSAAGNVSIPTGAES